MLQKLKEAEVVLDVIGAGLSEACGQELNAAMVLGRNVIVMSDPIFAPLLQPSFGSNLVGIDPANPDQAEGGIVQHLKALDAGQNAKKALLSLGRSRSVCLSSPLRIKADPDAEAPLYHPQAVREDLFKRRATKDRLQSLFDSCVLF